MRLVTALDIRPREVVSFVGGGGKTTAMFRLAGELVDEGKRVITTTTTRIFAGQIGLAPYHIPYESDDQVLREVPVALERQRHVLVIGLTREEGKAFGVSPGLVDQLAAMQDVDAVLIEADGSRMRPFKAPGEHEPVIPTSTTLLVPVVGIDALDSPLDDEHVHRPELVSTLAGVHLGTRVDPQVISRVLAHPQGGLKSRPAQARVIPLVNKASNVAQLLAGRDLAWQLLQSPAIEAVAVGAVKQEAMPVAELHRRVAAVVLAAGGSTRMQGQLKQLLPWGNSTLVRHTVDVARRGEVVEVVVVVGQRADEVRKALEGSGARVVVNPAWNEGRSTSVRAGLDALGPEIRAAIFVNADQPFLTPSVIDTLVQRYFHTLAPIVVPVYDGQSGSPVLFGRELFSELHGLAGEYGGKQLVQAHRDQVERVNVINMRAALDIDTPEQYQAALEEARTHPPEAIMSTVSHGEK